MINHSLGSLDLHRPPSRKQPLNGVCLQNTAAVKEQLLGEMAELSAQLDNLKADTDGFDFSLSQTYKEMIHVRRQFYNALSR